MAKVLLRYPFESDLRVKLLDFDGEFYWAVLA